MRIGRFRLPTRWRSIRLPYKLVLVYTPLILLPALAGIYYLTESYTSSSKAQAAEYATDLLGLMGQKVDDRMRSYEQLSKQIMTDGELLKLAKTEPESAYDRFKVESAINEKLNVLWLGADQNSYIRSIKIETPSAIYTYGKNAIDEYDVRNSEYRTEVGEMKGGARWFAPQTFDDGYTKLRAFRLGRTIRDEKLNELGTLTLVIRVEAVGDIFRQMKFQEDTALKLLDEKGEPLVDNEVSIGDVKASRLLSFTDDRLGNGWTLAVQMQLDRLYEPIFSTVRQALFILFGCILLGLVVTHLLALDLVIPIRRLTMNMKMGIKGVRPGKLKRFGGAVEIVEMNDTFISIMYEIEQLIDEVARQEKKKKDAEIRVLQHQLSPHFLYNTLNSIRWMAMIQRQDNIKEMVDALNALLTYALRGSGGPVPLASEIAILHNYVAIQKVRYQHFEFAVNVPAELEQVEVLKFLLQPLIENALIHGLAPSEHPGEITVSAVSEGEHLLVTVADNGIGMNEETVERLVRGLSASPTDRLGVRSVHERIQLHYGTNYGLSIRSEPGVGTSITVRVPMRMDGSAEEKGERSHA
ncbi:MULTISPECIES: cache domain-containing sensor histidine kinase [Cohnella]|uniref:Sensor histidine kinase YesM n=1 Tax=Cohnella phaseoli TaxID=456490 RepID=A0A3D9KDG3_9BACL|nr:sensor histidine kinase [Cohnella phaseoli]RED84322.1 sensor histidine kinase YesM [Cohnella phaseoli]